MASPPPLPDPRTAGGRLTIDLDALRQNWRQLARLAAPAEAAGVVKADAYGLGAEQVGPALWREGCRRFFVALPEEGAALREWLPDAEIFILSGLFEAGSAALYHDARLVPVLNSRHEAAIWEAHGWDGEVPRPCALHVDTGMNRLGFSVQDAISYAEENSITDALTPIVVMSHLACADTPHHPLNARQREAFGHAAAAYPGARASLANSAGILLGTDYCLDLARPGIALYGGNPGPAGENPMRPVVRAEARIVQLRRVPAGGSVSYGAGVVLARDSLVATVGVGYADGFLRSLSGAGVPLRGAVAAGGHGYLRDRKVPVLGRVTMDLTMFDVTDIGDDMLLGEWIELFGPNIAIDEAAMAAGTIAYEMLTSLGRRYHRRYLAAD